MKIKKISVFILVSLMLLSILPFSALAESESESDIFSLSVVFKDGSKIIENAGFNVYLIATPDENGGYTPTDSFADHPVDYDVTTDEELYILAATLEGYVFFSKEEPIYSGRTDENGVFSFTTEEKGMYLVIGEQTLVGDIFYTAESFIICLPSADEDGNAISDVSVNAKFNATHINASPITRKAVKIWNDDKDIGVRPVTISVYLLKNGEIYDSVVLGKDNNWSHTWRNLDPTARWNLVELPIENYLVHMTREGTAYFIKNTFRDPTPSTPDLPQTGQRWWPIPIFSVLGVALIAVGIIFTKKKSSEK